MKTAVDLFCGAGGTSTGMLLAAHELGQHVSLLAINHWNIAIDTHTQNHPHARHLCESLDNVDPRKAIPGRLHLLCASPECTHHSIARGGRPRSDQSRASAWHIVRWAEAKQPDCILVENVREFRDWGPLRKDGKPMKRYKGKTFTAFLNALSSLGYEVEHRILNCADYGDPTTRQRLFIMARRRGKIVWPEASHAGRWRAAREIIDWTLKGQSISSRKKPLSANTMKRIRAGLEKFGGEKFLLQWDQTGANGNYVRSIDQPCPTFCTKQNTALVEPFLIHTTHHGKRPAHSVEHPVPTVTGAHRGELALIEPFLVKFHGSHAGRTDGDKRVYGIEQPVPTLDCSNRLGLCEPYLVHLRGTQAAQLENSAKSVEEPLPTLTTSGAHVALCEPFLVKYNGTGDARPVTEPLDTVTTRDRFGLVEGGRLDIRFRMLQPHELAAAMGFPESYRFTGTREAQVKQIGNAVPVRTAAALCKELLQ